MKLWTKKIFNLSDIRYPWILLISMVIFLFSLYHNKINPNISVTVQWITYGSSIAIGFVWSILNYVGHIKVNAIYNKKDNIDAYVENLIMEKEEKEDLKTYLNDFVKDLEAQGKTKDKAIEIAISQFQVQEFTSLSKNGGLLDLPTHYYLIGYMVIFIVGMIILQGLTSTVLRDFFLLHAINFTLNLYVIGFLGTLLLYKLIDILIAKKIKG